MRKAHPYVELMRLEKPIGSWLLFWPGAWSIAMANYSLQEGLNWKLLGLFGVGSIVMRGAGCTINDLWDRRIDRLVERTQSRPLAANRLTPLQAVVFLGGQLTIGLAILLQLNWPSVLLGAASLLPVVLYPLMKRVTYWPQFVLGMTFNWGALLGWTATLGTFNPHVLLPLYTAGISWTMLYDTIYALQDIKDDLQANVKSTAIKFGENVKIWLAGFGCISTGSFIYAGGQNAMGPIYYTGVTLAAVHMAWQVYTLKRHDVMDCLRKFKSNRWVGAIIFAGIALDIASQQLAINVSELLSSKAFL